MTAHVTHMPSTASADALLRWSQPAGERRTAMEWLHQALCGLRGHATVLHFESSRLSLQCTSCGHTTSGWTIETPPRTC